MFSVAIKFKKLSIFVFIKVVRKDLASFLLSLSAYYLGLAPNCFGTVPTIKVMK